MGALLVACNLKQTNESTDLKSDNVKKQIDKTIDQANDVEICPGFTLDELLHANSLTPECRDARALVSAQAGDDVQGPLARARRCPQRERRDRRSAAGRRDKDGAALTSDDLEKLEVSVVVNGETQKLDATDFAFAADADLTATCSRSRWSTTIRRA